MNRKNLINYNEDVHNILKFAIHWKYLACTHCTESDHPYMVLVNME